MSDNNIMNKPIKSLTVEDVVELNEMGYILCGKTYSYDGLSYDTLVFMLDLPDAPFILLDYVYGADAYSSEREVILDCAKDYILPALQEYAKSDTTTLADLK